MAFKKIATSSNGSIPFFADWVKEQDEEYLEFLVDKVMEPKTIKAVASGKGYLINFNDQFMVFEWKSGMIGKLLKRMIIDECGSMILLCFTKTKKSYSFEMGIDEDIEVAITEDKYDEGIYTTEATTETPPIAPSENRKFLCDIPVMEPAPPVAFTPTKKTKPKPSARSDGSGT